MATSVKSKFAGLLRGLLRQLDDRAPAPPAPAPAPPAGTSVPVSPVAPQNISLPPRSVAPDGLELPLAPIVAALPMDLRAKLMAVPPAGAAICVASETVMSQLAFGAVKISFGELRQLAPGVFANSGGEHDNRPISLPLGEILARLNPSLLARRSTQTAGVSEDISGPFDGRGKGITFTTHPLKPAPPAPNLPVPEAEPAPARLPMVSPMAAFNPPPRPVMPTVPLTFPPRQTAPTVFTPPPASANNGHSNGHNGHGPEAPAPAMKFTATPIPAPVPVPPASASPTIFVSLSELAQTWPEELRAEITRSNLADASVPLAAALVEPGLKRGRVTMTWKQLRTLARPSSPPSPQDTLELDLSLKVLAPIFLDAQKSIVRPVRKVSVSAEIPNLFFGFPQPAAEPPAPAAPAAVFLPSPAAAKAVDTNFFGRQTESETELRRADNPATDFLNRQAHPKEVVARAAALPGVAGAVVALPDGLRVAAAVPAELNADTLAAFLPQIFERLNQSTRELRMGPLNNLSFTVGSVPWKIFRVSSVYFAVFGRAGEPLPTAQLAGMAQELDRKKSK